MLFLKFQEEKIFFSSFNEAVTKRFWEKFVFFAIESVLIFMMPDAMAASDVDVTDISDNEFEKTSDSDFSNTETGQIIYLSLSLI